MADPEVQEDAVDGQLEEEDGELVYLTGPAPEPQPRQPFKCPNVISNENVWGPAGACSERFEDMPYQPFAKSDRLGKAADITGTAFQRPTRFQSMFGAGDAYAFFNGEDESSFNIVHSKKKTDNMFGRRKWQNRTSRRDLFRQRDDRRLAGLGMQPLSKAAKNRERDRARLERRWQRRWAGRRKFTPRAELVQRDSSVDVKATWKILDEIDLAKLAKLSMNVDAPQDVLTCGKMQYFDKTVERISVRQPRAVVNTDRQFHTVTTTDDPNIRELSKGDTANVFGTDAILSAIMCCQRSVYSFDVVIHRVGKKVFFDKRDDSDFDYLTANETAFETPNDDGMQMDSPDRLAFEATYLNRVISQQVLKKGTQYSFKEPSPFDDGEEEQASVGYRYRKWNLGDAITLIARTEHDGAYKDKQGRTGFMNVKCLNEWKMETSMDWRQKLDVQRGAVLATELKNNACKVAKWTTNAMLAGSSQLRLCYATRTSPADNTRHLLLGSQIFKPKDLATQVNLNMKNGWAILKSIIDLVMQYEEGKYVLLKDPNKPVLRLYSVPAGTFEDSDSDSDSDDDDADQVGVRIRDDADGVDMTN